MTILAVRPATVNKALPRLADWLKATPHEGELLACWVSEIGALNRILLLRGYADRGALLADRDRAATGAEPFGIADLLTGRTADIYVGFPMLPPVRPGAWGPVYEVRSYQLKADGVPATIAGWEKTLPGRVALSKPLVGMYSITGANPRFVHIWPYADLNQRQRIRGEAVEKGLWPPPGGSERLVEMQSEIYLPTAFSPTT
jgi:hypothetical protein